MTSRPTVRKCPYCGAELRPRTAELFGKTVRCGFFDCTCEASKEARARELEEAAERERRDVLDSQMRRYRAAGIPPLFLKHRSGCESLYEDVRREAGDVVSAFKRGRGSYIVGGVGTGKSLVAATAARYAVDCGLGARFTSASEVLDAVRSSFGTSKDSRKVMDFYASTRFLVLDDLGKESPTDWVLMKLFELVNDRYENMRPLVVTTQYQRDELIARLAKNGDKETAVAIVSRLAETCDVRELTGRDRRLGNG